MKTINNHEIYLAIKSALEGLGLEEIGGGDNSYGIGTIYLADDNSSVEITISNPPSAYASVRR